MARIREMGKKEKNKTHSVHQNVVVNDIGIIGSFSPVKTSHFSFALVMDEKQGKKSFYLCGFVEDIIKGIGY
jgi:hypothetical protein